MSESGGGFFKAAIGTGVLAAGLGVGFYFGIYLPGRDQVRTSAMAECMKAAYDDYTKDWETSCAQLKMGKNCKLPLLIARDKDERRHQSVDECNRLGP